MLTAEMRKQLLDEIKYYEEKKKDKNVGIWEKKSTRRLD